MACPSQSVCFGFWPGLQGNTSSAKYFYPGNWKYIMLWLKKTKATFSLSKQLEMFKILLFMLLFFSLKNRLIYDFANFRFYFWRWGWWLAWTVDFWWLLRSSASASLSSWEPFLQWSWHFVFIAFKRRNTSSFPSVHLDIFIFFWMSLKEH